MEDQDNIQELLSPMKRLKTTTAMETTTVKTEPVKTAAKSSYLVKVIYQ